MQTGKKHERHFRIVVSERRSKRDGKTVDQIGHFHPRQNEIVINQEKYKQWTQKGAQPTETVRKLVIRQYL